MKDNEVVFHFIMECLSTTYPNQGKVKAFTKEQRFFNVPSIIIVVIMNFFREFIPTEGFRLGCSDAEFIESKEKLWAIDLNYFLINTLSLIYLLN